MKLLATFEITNGQEQYMVQALARLGAEINHGGMTIHVTDRAIAVATAPSADCVLLDQADADPSSAFYAEVAALSSAEPVPVETQREPGRWAGQITGSSAAKALKSKGKTAQDI